MRAGLTRLDAAPERQQLVRVSDGETCVAVLRLAPCDRTPVRLLRLRALETTTYTECRHQDVLTQPGVDARAVWAALTRRWPRAGSTRPCPMPRWPRVSARC